MRTGFLYVVILVLTFNMTVAQDFSGVRSGVSIPHPPLKAKEKDTVHVRPPKLPQSQIPIAEADTSENESTILAETDTLITDFSKIDPEFLEDQLACAQKDIHLNYFKPVHRLIEFYIADKHEYTERMLARAEYFFPIFEEYLKKYDLPEELKYLAVVESALNPNAVSRAGAVGLWQFMRPTARDLNLKIDGFVDERRDIHKSTDAACRYLKMLHNYFGDWELALAAYNCGMGYVRRAVRRAGYKKSFQDIYWYLPRETRAYVPSFVAVAYAFNYGEQHHLHLHPDSVLTMAYDTIQVSHYLDLIKFAEMLDEDFETIKEMNPKLKASYIPGHYNDFVLNIPADKKECFSASRAEIMDSASQRKVERLVHVVRRGESLGLIAQRYGVYISQIREWNGLRNNIIYPGQRLVMWKVYHGHTSAFKQQQIAQKKKKQKEAKATIHKGGKEIYIVQPGDTLWGISKLKSISVDRLIQINDLKSKMLKPGQRLVVG